MDNTTKNQGTFGCVRDAIIVAVIHYRRLEVRIVHLDTKTKKNKKKLAVIHYRRLGVKIVHLDTKTPQTIAVT